MVNDLTDDELARFDWPGDYPDDAWLDEAFARDERQDARFGLVSSVASGGRVPWRPILEHAARDEITVSWEAGWDVRGAPSMAPEGIGLHWTAANPTDARPAPSLVICRDGRPAGKGVTAVPGPLVPALVGLDGVLHILASGRGNHWGPCDTNVLALLGKPLPDRVQPGPDNGGSGGRLIGVEIEQRGDRPYSPAQVRTVTWLVVQLCRWYRWDPLSRVLAHEEGTRRKVDFTDPRTTPWTTPGVARRMFAFAMAQPTRPAAPVVELGKPLLRRTLTVGSNGAEVRHLQQLLRIPVNGHFGTATRAAVIRAQKAAGLPATGIVDPATWDRLATPTKGR